jgi:hypothetical protein
MKKMNAFLKSNGLEQRALQLPEALSIADELISDFRLSKDDKYHARSDWRQSQGRIGKLTFLHTSALESLTLTETNIAVS